MNREKIFSFFNNNSQLKEKEPREKVWRDNCRNL